MDTFDIFFESAQKNLNLNQHNHLKKKLKKSYELMRDSYQSRVNYLQNLSEAFLTGKPDEIAKHHTTYAQESLNRYQDMINLHRDFIEHTPTLVEESLKAHRKNHKNVMKKLEKKIKEFNSDASPKNPWTKLAGTLAYGALLGAGSLFTPAPKLKASVAVERVPTFEPFSRMTQHYQPAPLKVVTPPSAELSRGEQEKLNQAIQQIVTRFNQLTQKNAINLLAHDVIALQQAILDSLSEQKGKEDSSLKNTLQKSKDQLQKVLPHETNLYAKSLGEDPFLKALQETKNALKPVPQEEINLYASILSKKPAQQFRSELENTIKGLRHVPEEEKNLFAKSLQKAPDIIPETSKTIAKLETDNPQTKPALAAALAGQEESTAKPELTVAYLDMLKELKQKFAPKKDEEKSLKIKDLNEISEQIYETPTGAYLKYRFPHKDLEVSVSRAVRELLSEIHRDQFKKNRIASDAIIAALNTDFNAVHKEVTELVRQILISSASDPDYYVMYHGHGNSLRLYLDMLREVKSLETIQELAITNPMRDKTAKNAVRTVDDILENYESEALKYAKDNNTELYTDKRVLGVNFAPDKIGFIRDHVISTNLNLFGNTGLLAECTLFYFIDSFNISNPNEALVKGLLQRLSAPDTDEEILQRKIKRYTDLYESYMGNTGGNLMEIKIKKGDFEGDDDRVHSIDDIAFASWMKGIPVWVNEETGKIATKKTNFDVVPILTKEREGYERPSMSSYLDLMTSDTAGFIEKYSNFSGKGKITRRDKLISLDRPQARLVIDPVTFNDGKNIKVKQFTRNEVPEDRLRTYQEELRRLIREDIQEYITLIEDGKISPPTEDRLAFLLKFMEQGRQA